MILRLQGKYINILSVILTFCWEYLKLKHSAWANILYRCNSVNYKYRLIEGNGQPLMFQVFYYKKISTVILLNYHFYM